ncbi:MAG TPA: pitrilysin family protein [Myxococcaceae bacterium]|nr:pitrilysin family protein [Myxococcaceae bacterium]
MSERFVLSNGLTVVFEEQHAAPVAAFQIWVRVGGADEQPDEAGLAHLHEHMLFKGSALRGPGELARDLEARGGEVNAWTSFDETVYHVVLASRFAREGLEALSDAVRTPRFDPEELAREIEVVCEEIKRSQDAPVRRASRLLFSHAYQGHPYANPVLGSAGSVRSFDAAAMRRFYETHYVPQNMVLSAVGDVTRAEIQEWAETFLGGDWKRGAPRPRKRPEVPVREGVQVTLQREDLKETFLYLSFPAVPFQHPDAPVLDLLAMLYGQGDTSRLVREIKRERGLVNQIHLSSYTPREQGLLLCSLTLAPENAEAALEATLGILASLRDTLPSEEELQTVKATVEADAIYGRETVQGLARKLGFYETDGGGLEAEARYYEAIAAVTPEQVREVAQRYLRLDRTLLTGLLPEAATLTEEKALALIRNAQPTPTAEDPERPRKRVPDGLHVLPSGRGRDAQPMRTHRLASGLELVIREEHNVPLVAVRAAALGGLRYETPEDNGLTALLSRVLSRGAGDLGAHAFTEELDLLSASISATAGRSSMSVRGDFLARHFTRSFELFASCLTAPRLDVEEVERERQLQLQHIRNRDDRPTGLAFHQFGRALWTRHPYRLHPHGEEETLSALTREALADYHRSWLRPDQLVLAVVGDVDADEVIRQAEALFPRREDPAPERPVIPIEPPPSAPVSVHHRLDRAQSQLVVGFRGARVTDPWRHALEVLVTVLSGQGGRLFTELRDRRSLAYSVGAFSLEGVDPGSFSIYMGTSPEKVEEALTGIREELTRVCETRISDDELVRARENLVGAHEIGLQRNAARAALIAVDRTYGMSAENFLHFSERVNAVTAADVQEVAQRIIQFPQEVVALVGP